MRMLLLLLAVLAVTVAWAEPKQWNEEAGFDLFMPDAGMTVLPWDGGDAIAGGSWLVSDNVFDRDLWLDLLLPVSRLGGGLSLQVVPQAPLALGAYYQDRWFMGLTAHTAW